MHLSIKEIKEGKETPFFDSGDMTWSDVPYPGMVAVEGIFIGALDVLNDFGLDMSEMIADPDVTKKVKEFKDKVKGKNKEK